MDIDDILREVDPSFDSIPEETRDLQLLTRAWVAERSAPELLDWPADGLFERINERIKQQIEKVEMMTGDMDPKTNFALIVMQTELERYKFLTRSYLRARIAKIDRHAQHYLQQQEENRMSATERAYAQRHQALLHNHYLSSFLSSFPATMHGLADASGNVSMVDVPDLDAAVFVRVLRDGGEDGEGRRPLLVRGQGVDQDDEIEAVKGDIVILRWADAKPLVESGRAELV